MAAAAQAMHAQGRVLEATVNTSSAMDAAISSSQLESDIAVLWILLCGYLVFFMQCGFALLESGTVRKKNTRNILLKNAIDGCVATLSWWALGYAFAYGSTVCSGPQNGFIGHANFFTSESQYQSGTFWANWFFGWAFASTAGTIVSGAVAERAQFKAYVIYTTFITTWVYPVVVHWVWSDSGWLAARRQTECGVVHMVGGGAALMGAIMIGPRVGRFDDGNKEFTQHSSPTNMAVGTFILWLGWYAFNAGSGTCFSTNCMHVAAEVSVNTTLAASSGGLTCLLLAIFLGESGDISPLLNGVLAGLVSITAPCATVQAYSAVIIGVLGGCVYTGASALLRRLHVDDPLDASPVHFFCGMWGILSVGFFSTKTSTERVYGYANDWGVFYGGQGYQLGVQLLGMLCIGAWTCALNGMLFFVLHKKCWLRVPRDVEQKGLDIAQALGSGSIGACFGFNPYTESVRTGLSREGARDKSQDYTV